MLLERRRGAAVRPHVGRPPLLSGDSGDPRLDMARALRAHDGATGPRPPVAALVELFAGACPLAGGGVPFPGSWRRAASSWVLPKAGEECQRGGEACGEGGGGWTSGVGWGRAVAGVRVVVAGPSAGSGPCG